MLGRLLQLVVRTTREALVNDVGDRAAALAYYQLLCAMPLGLLALAGAAWFVGSAQEVEGRLMALWGSFVPGAAGDVRAAIRILVESSGVFSGIGLAGLVLAGSRLFTCLEGTMNRIWDAPKRSWWRSRILTLAMTLAVEGAISVAFGLSLLQRLDDLSARLMPSMLQNLGASGILLGFLIAFAGYLLIFRWLPNRRVHWRASLVAAALCAAAFEAARFGFEVYVDNFANYNVVFGSLAGVFILMLWAFAVALITLVGAEFGSVWEQVVENTGRRAPGVGR